MERLGPVAVAIFFALRVEAAFGAALIFCFQIDQTVGIDAGICWGISLFAGQFAGNLVG